MRANIRRPVSAFTKDDLPTFDLPAKQISGRVVGGNALILFAAAIKLQLPAKSNRPVSRASALSHGPRFSLCTIAVPLITDCSMSNKLPSQLEKLPAKR